MRSAEGVSDGNDSSLVTSSGKTGPTAEPEPCPGPTADPGTGPPKNMLILPLPLPFKNGFDVVVCFWVQDGVGFDDKNGFFGMPYTHACHARHHFNLIWNKIFEKSAKIDLNLWRLNQ